ncbi:MAG: hypothetical protein K2Z81_13685 [Cyanobacteria bacterium]|nr:hypothetical protein [Cyanobacteriota bacterium]
MDPDKSRTHNRRDEVMLEFQHSMLEMTKSFLAAQERVMLAYLSSTELAPESHEPYRQIERSTFAVDRSHNHNSAALSYSSTTYENQWQSQTPQNESIQTDWTDVELPVTTEYIQEEPTPTNGRHETSHREFATWTNPSELQEGTATVKAASPHQTQQPAATAQEQNGDSAVSADSLIASLLEIVSDRTGYPPEMLDPSLDMEADLGIDSIKRVEILTSLRKLLPESRREQLENSIEQVVGIKSLQGIIDWIREEFSDSNPSESDGERNSVEATVGV